MASFRRKKIKDCETSPWSHAVWKLLSAFLSDTVPDSGWLLVVVAASVVGVLGVLLTFNV